VIFLQFPFFDGLEAFHDFQRDGPMIIDGELPFLADKGKADRDYHRRQDAMATSISAMMVPRCFKFAFIE
jgi:hypothetical protein